MTEVFKMVNEISIKTLILNHFSSRYSNDEILKAALKHIKEFGIDIPVYLIYPGEIKRDILAGQPIN